MRPLIVIALLAALAAFPPATAQSGEIRLVPAATEIVGAPGETIVVEVDVSNSGATSARGEVAARLATRTWHVQPAVANYSLGPDGGTQRVRLSVTLPTDHESGIEDDLVIVARPRSDGPAAAVVYAEARVLLRVAWLEVAPASARVAFAPGETRRVEWTVANANRYAVDANVEMLAPTGGWSISPAREAATFAAGATRTLAYDVTAPRDATSTTLALVLWARSPSWPHGKASLAADVGSTPRAVTLDFTSDTLVVAAGHSETAGIGVVNDRDARATVQLRAVGLPEGITASFTTDTFTLASRESARTGLVIAVGPLVAPSERFTITVQAQSDGGVVTRPFFVVTADLPTPESPQPIEDDDGGATDPPVADPPPEAPLSPATLAVAGATGATAAAGAGVVAWRRDPLKWAALAPLAGLYTRLAKPDLLKHEVREKLHRDVQENPGITFTELMRRHDLNNGAVVHHLRALERAGFVASRRDGLARRFYPAAAAAGRVAAAAATERLTPMQERILSLLEEGPMTQRAIADRLGVTKQGANFHVKTLERKGHVAFERAGDEWVCVRVRELRGVE